jgi:ribosome-associated toxin RatA of RatAB toxin-antitoxin module
MKKISRSVLVNYSIEQMYGLINDIEAYPKFMEACIDAKVLDSGDDFIEARLVLRQSGIQQSFVTRNELHPPKLMIMHLVEGPFKHFEGRWQFEPLGESGCKVSVCLSFMFANPLLTLTVGKWFERAVCQQVDALCQRADTLFGS